MTAFRTHVMFIHYGYLGATVVPFTPDNTPHSNAINDYGVAKMERSGQIVPVSRKREGIWKELVTNSVGAVTFHVKGVDYGSYNHYVTEQEMKTFYSRGTSTAQAPVVVKEPDAVFPRDVWVICPDTKQSQYVPANCMVGEFERIMKGKGVNLERLRVVDLSTNTVKPLYTVKTVLTIDI